MMRSSTVRLASQLFRNPSSPTTCCFNRSINTNSRHQNTAATVEPNLNNHNDKCLHYSHEEGYFKTSPFETLPIPNLPLDKYVWRDFKKWENNVATVS